MKKLFILLLLLPGVVQASGHLEVRRADIITNGTLPNNVLDPSSVTLQGNSVNINTLGSISQRRGYDLIVGPAGASNVDLNVANETDWNTMLIKLNSMGLTFNSTAPIASVFFTTGSYFVNNATVPSNIKLFALEGSSTEINNVNAFQGMVMIYGEMNGFTFNVSSGADLWPNNGGYFSRQVRVMGAGKLKNSVIKNAVQINNMDIQACALCVQESSDVIIDNVSFSSVAARSAQTLSGDDSPIQISTSNNVVLRRLSIIDSTYTSINSNATFFGIRGSSNVIVEDCNWGTVGGDFIGILKGTNNFTYQKNRHIITMPSATGFITGNANSLNYSTVTVRNCEFNIRTDGSSTLINHADGGIKSSLGNSILYNFITSIVPNTYKFFNIQSSGYNRTVLAGNIILGGLTYGTDSGTASRITGNDDFLNGTEQ